MSDQKISQLSALTEADSADELAIVDTSATETKKITKDNLLKGKEDLSNKKTSLADNSDTYYPSQKAVKTAVDAKASKASNETITGDWEFDGQFSAGGPTHSAYRARIFANTKTVSANETNHYIGIQSNQKYQAIEEGYTDSGYRRAIWAEGWIYDTNFKGTLATQAAYVAQYGIYSAGTSGARTVTNARGIYIQPYYKAGTVTNGYGIYIAAPITGGTVTNEWAIYSADDAPVYFAGDLTAASYADNTPAYEGNALEDIKKIKTVKGEIDHDSLPTFAQTTIKKPKYKKGTEEYDGQEITKGRDLGAMISILTKAVQELSDEVDKLKK
jgi:hypothetical protein